MSKDGLEKTSYIPFKRFLIEVAFDGTLYGGWQIQPNAPTVQETIQKTLRQIYNDQFIHLIGSSRTDSGVHALGFAASFLVPERPAVEPAYLMRALNRMLPGSIAIRSIREVPLEFHSRYDALGKAYTYVFNLGRKSPFCDRYSWHLRRKLDWEKMQMAATHLVGKHDFSSFVVERSEIEEAVRTIFRIDFDSFDSYHCVTFIGDGFLYKMIRCLAGLLEAVGGNELEVAQVPGILEACDRTIAPETAPARGLFLMKVFYSPENPTDFKLYKPPFDY